MGSPLEDEHEAGPERSVAATGGGDAAGRQNEGRLAELTPAQRDLLLRRLRRRSTGAASSPRLVRLPRTDETSAPLSFAQERLWFADRLAPGDPAHNITGALRLEGHVSVPALSRSLDDIVARHETLRATFSQSAGTPVQVLNPSRPVSVVHHDLRSLEPDAREAELTRLYSRETRTGFDLERDLLLRPVLVRLAPEEHVLIVSLHHIASDGWSIGVVMRDLASLYAAHVEGRRPEMRDMPVRYGDFAAWQRATVGQGALEPGLAYWRRQLADPPPVLELPADLDVPPSPLHERTLDGATLLRHLGPERRAALEALGRDHDATLNATLLCAFQILLARWAGREDIVVGSPVSGRTRVETEGLVGLFLNTLALRAHLPGDKRFCDAVREVRLTLLEGLEHMDVPFEQVVKELVPERSASRHPLFGSFFNFTPTPIRAMDLGGLQATFLAPPSSGAQFSLELYVTERGQGLDLELLYHRSRYTRELMEAFLDQLDAILQQVVERPDTGVGDLKLAPAQHPLLSDPTAPLTTAPLDSVVERIAAQAAAHPEHTALEHGDRSTTYAELGRQMVGIAQALSVRGFEPGETVAVAGPRSPGVVVSMAGVLLAGGVLVTLSDDLPEKRRRAMVRESGARWLLHVGEPPELDGLVSIAVSAAGTVSGVEPVSLASWLRRHPIPPSDVPRQAYVFFTSGSTGTPKGVVGVHHGLAHFLDWQRRTFEVGPGHRCAQLVGLSFDVVLRDIFLALTSGATLVIPQGVDALSGDLLLRWLGEARITHLHTVPSVLETWLQDPPPGLRLPTVECVFSAGEPLTATLVGQARALLEPSASLVNLYGPTETTLAKCAYVVPDSPRAGIQPLGRPLPGAQALVLRPDRARCGIGEPGEIALRTPYRSLGYLNAPDEEARRFIPNPWTDDPDDLLYLTGDRGVLTASGLLEFRGRLDDQVKIGGVRVEPTEVAVALRACDEVGACAVVPREDIAGVVTLVAYVVTAEGFTSEAPRLREYLRTRLPGPMLPSTFVFLDRLPLTSNHKLDRSRLPAPSGVRPELESRYVAPRDDVELQLVRVWEDLLDVRPVGVTDSFFELGGHSLLALQLMVKVKRQLGRALPLPALFERPTVEHLASLAGRQRTQGQVLVQLWSAPSRVALFLVHPGGGMLWNYTHLVRHLAPDLPVYGIAARGLDGSEPPHDDLVAMATHYLEAVRAVQPEGPYLLAGHSLGGAVAYEMARQLEAREEEVGLLAVFDTTSPELRASLEANEELEDDTARLLDMVRAIEAFTGVPTDLSRESLDGLDLDAQVRCTVDALQAARALPLNGDVKLLTDLLEVGKAHVRARRGYRPPRSTVAMTLFRAMDGDVDDHTLGWSAASGGAIRTHSVPGDHVTMMSEPHVRVLAHELAGAIERGLGDGG